MSEYHKCEFEMVKDISGGSTTYKLYRGTEGQVTSKTSPTITQSVHTQPGHMRLDPSDADIIATLANPSCVEMIIVARDQASGAMVSVSWTRRECTQLAKLSGFERTKRIKQLLQEKLDQQGISHSPIGIGGRGEAPLIVNP